MPHYQYNALAADGTNVAGTLEAASRQVALTQLQGEGKQVVSLKETTAGSNGGGKGKAKGKKASASEKSIGDGPVDLSTRQVIQFTEEISDMLDAGLTLKQALDATGERSDIPKLRHVATHIRSRFIEGESLADALCSASGSFSNLYCNLAFAAEQSGTLGETLAKQVKYLTAIEELKGKVRTTLIYPAFLITSAFAVIAMFAFVLIPKLEVLIEATGGELPLIASLMSQGTAFLQERWWQVLAIVVAITAVIVIYLTSPASRPFKHRFVMTFPGVRTLYRDYFNLHFTQTLANLLGSGMQINQALGLCRGVTTNPLVIQHVDTVDEAVKRGQPLNSALEAGEIFDRSLIDMARVGVDTGELETSMAKAAIRMDRNFTRRIDKFTAMISPIITVIIAAIVGVMAYLMISIIYDTISAVRDRAL